MTNFWLQVAGSTVFGGIALAFVNAVINRKQLGAETNKTKTSAAVELSDSAMRQIKVFEDESGRLRVENRDTREQNDALRRRMQLLEDSEEELRDMLKQSNQDLHSFMVWAQQLESWAGDQVPPLKLPPAPRSPLEFQPNKEK